MDSYNIKQEVLQQGLSIYFKFELLHTIFHQINKFTNLQKTEKTQSDDPYPWLEKDDPRSNMTDREILENTVLLEHSCLTKRGKYIFMTCCINIRMLLV